MRPTRRRAVDCGAKSCFACGRRRVRAPPAAGPLRRAARMDRDDDDEVEGGGAEPAAKRARVVGEICAIASPMASDKLHKKLYKAVKRAAAGKNLRRGVKEVVKALRKGEEGLVVLAGDISPVDVISHIPVLCEDGEVPYIYVGSKADLGAAAATKRPTSVVFLAPKKGDADFAKEAKFVEVVAKVKAAQAALADAAP